MPVLDQMVKIRWSFRSKNKYISIGVPFTKIGDYFELHINKIPDDSNVDVKISCETCKIITTKKLSNIRDRKSTYCSVTCVGKANLNQVEFNCEECGKHSSKTETDYNKHDHHFCCQSCASTYFAKIKSESSRVYCECEQCRESYTVIKSQYERLGSRFCSVPCRNKWESENKIGANHHRYNSKEVNCTYCNGLICVKDSKIKKQDNHFCNTECRQKWYAEVWSQQEDWIEESKIRATNQLQNSPLKTNTSIQSKVNSMLDDMKINYENEYNFKYYSADNYLPDYNLVIEVMGDYWHTNPLRYPILDKINKMQQKRIWSDKSKNTYIKKWHEIDMLYLWELDIKKNQKLCIELILLYIENKGELKDYSSFNYHLNANEKIELNSSLTVPYFLENNNAS